MKMLIVLLVASVSAIISGFVTDPDSLVIIGWIGGCVAMILAYAYDDYIKNKP